MLLLATTVARGDSGGSSDGTAEPALLAKPLCSEHTVLIEGACIALPSSHAHCSATLQADLFNVSTPKLFTALPNGGVINAPTDCAFQPNCWPWAVLACATLASFLKDGLFARRVTAMM